METPLSWHSKCSLPVAVRVSKMRVLKLPIEPSNTVFTKDASTSASVFHPENADLFNHFHHSRETGCGGGRTTKRGSKLSAPFYPPNLDIARKTDHKTGNYMPYSLRQVCGFFFVPQDYRPYPRRLDVITRDRCNYKGSTFSSII